MDAETEQVVHYADNTTAIAHYVDNDLVSWLKSQRPVAAQVCLKTLFLVARSKNAPATSRVAAARALGEFAGVLGVKGAAGASKDPEQMSTSELHSQVQALERALAERAKVIGNAPPQPVDLDQLFDIA